MSWLGPLLWVSLWVFLGLLMTIITVANFFLMLAVFEMATEKGRVIEEKD